MADPAPPRVICFDIGGVIVRICRSWEEGCAAAGLDVRSPDVHEATSRAREDLVVRYQTGRLDTSSYFREMSGLSGGAYSSREIEAIHHAWLIEQFDGVKSLIESIHDAGIATAALSNTNPAHWSRMGEFPAVMTIRHHFVSHQLGLHKPDGQIFVAVQRQLGVAGSLILYFDDLDENVGAARRCGWQAELIDPLNEPARQMRAALHHHGVLGPSLAPRQ